MKNLLFANAKKKQRRRSAVKWPCSRAVDQRLCLYNRCTPKIRHFKPLAIFCGCTAWFVSHLVENPKDRLSCDAAQMVISEKMSVTAKNNMSFGFLTGLPCPDQLQKIATLLTIHTLLTSRLIGTVFNLHL